MKKVCNLGADHDGGAACITDNDITGSEIKRSELSGSTNREMANPLFHEHSA